MDGRVYKFNLYMALLYCATLTGFKTLLGWFVVLQTFNIDLGALWENILMVFDGDVK
jgi:hypothetical protein